MRKLILTIFFLVVAVLLAWTVFTVLRQPSNEPPPAAEQPAAVKPQVSEPAPDSLEALTADTLDEALADIDELTK